jgi:hypothetical protein
MSKPLDMLAAEYDAILAALRQAIDALSESEHA